jgi:hypothetical protein
MFAIVRSVYRFFDFLSFRPKPVPPLLIDLETGIQATNDSLLPYNCL